MVGAVGAALLQLAAQILSFSAPIAVTGITVMAAAAAQFAAPTRQRPENLRTYGVSFGPNEKIPATGGNPYVRAEPPKRNWQA